MNETPISGSLSAHKTAIILLNLGGPASEADIAPFLFSFFRDKNVITVPNPFRYLLAAWIAWSRSRGAARESYAQLGGKSPLLENTRAQAKALEETLLKEGIAGRVFVVMRHAHPRADDVVREVAAYQPDKIILLPLYPQYSTTTTLSALQDWSYAVRQAELDIPTETIYSYQTDPAFTFASADRIRDELKKTSSRVRILFSAHGLPQKIIDKGDPYQRQCEESCAAIVQELGPQATDWQICYQSRVGRLKWIGPSIEEALQRAAEDGVGVVIYPLAFVSEHVETLVELDIEYKERAAEMGIQPYLRAQTVGTHPRFIMGLCDLIKSKLVETMEKNK